MGRLCNGINGAARVRANVLRPEQLWVWSNTIRVDCTWDPCHEPYTAIVGDPAWWFRPWDAAVVRAATAPESKE